MPQRPRRETLANSDREAATEICFVYNIYSGKVWIHIGYTEGL